MCGIFALIGKTPYTETEIRNASLKGQRRGPEYSTLMSLPNDIKLGFHRLAINGLNSESHQPLNIEDKYSLICNGEIYNYKELYAEMKIKPETDSDCEVILHIYKNYGVDGIFRLVDGVFAFVLVDMSENKVIVARDAFGVRPMFTALDKEGSIFGFASEMKQLHALPGSEKYTIRQFEPGTYASYSYNGALWEHQANERFANLPYMTRMDFPFPSEYSIYKYIGQIGCRLQEAVQKRVQTTDRPIACLLSGGLDSSLVTALVAMNHPDKSKLETYSIGFPGSVDLKYAEKVAAHLGTKHTSIEVTEQEFLNAIPEVIYAIESYDTTTVRASVGNFLVAKYIKEHSNAKVIFNGDGSDEMTGGYLYFHECPSSIEFDMECRRLIKNIHYFDVLRSDRCISYHGLEARTPFLDRSLVEHYFTIPREMRNHNVVREAEKFILRQCLGYKNILPDEVLHRTKEAFSDGVSSHKKSWYETIQENIPSEFWDTNEYDHLVNPPKTPEQRYYRSIFEKHYGNRGEVIPYFWMPRYTDAKDCSARSLNLYETLVQK